MSLNPPAQRNATADLLKGVAVVLMIQVHIIEQFATEELLHSTIGRVSLFLGGPPAAPVFLTVMGYFAINSSRTFGAHVQRGLYLIGGGLLLNLGLNANLLYSIAIGRFNLDPLAFVLGADILPLAGLSVIVLALLVNAVGHHPLILLAGALLAAAIAPLLSDLGAESALRYIVPFLWGRQWWSYFPLFPWLSYVLLGAAFGVSRRAHDQHFLLASRSRSILTAAVAMMLVATAPFVLPDIVELPSYYHHGLGLMLWIAAFLVVWTLFADSFERLAGGTAPLRYLKWLGRNVTTAYVIQWLLIGNIATALYRTQNLAQATLWFIGILVATSVLTATFRSIKRSLVNAPA